MGSHAAMAEYELKAKNDVRLARKKLKGFSLPTAPNVKNEEVRTLNACPPLGARDVTRNENICADVAPTTTPPPPAQPHRSLPRTAAAAASPCGVTSLSLLACSLART